MGPLRKNFVEKYGGTATTRCRADEIIFDDKGRAVGLQVRTNYRFDPALYSDDLENKGGTVGISGPLRRSSAAPADSPTTRSCGRTSSRNTRTSSLPSKSAPLVLTLRRHRRDCGNSSLTPNGRLEKRTLRRAPRMSGSASGRGRILLPIDNFLAPLVLRKFCQFSQNIRFPAFVAHLSQPNGLRWSTVMRVFTRTGDFR